MEALQGDPDVLRKTVFLLPANHRHGDVEQLKRLGIGACLVTPIKRAELLDALQRTLAMAGKPAPD